MKTGIVKSYNPRYGWGFITVHESEEDIFVHKNGLIDSIKENDIVTFEVSQNDKGPIAVDVKAKITSVKKIDCEGFEVGFLDGEANKDEVSIKTLKSISGNWKRN